MINGLKCIRVKKIKKYFLFVILVFLIFILMVLKIKYSDTEEVNTNVKNGSSVSISSVLEEPTPTITTENNNEVQNREGVEVVSTEINDEAKIDGVDYSYTSGTETDFTDNYDVGYFLEPYLPYQGKNFKINRYLKADYLEVLVKDNDNLNQAVSELESWLSTHNTDCNEIQCIYVFE